MFTTDLTVQVAAAHRTELIEQASRHRLVASLRKGRRQRSPDLDPRASATVTSRDAGRLAACGPAVGQAR
jgi:hypothetical protein